MKAMILAAGFGTRLGELTRDRPKCLIDVGGKTILDCILEKLSALEVSGVVINLHHRGDQIEAYLGSRKFPGLQIHFSKEEKILGTGGGIRAARAQLDDGNDFFVFNGDIYTDADLAQMLAAHRKERSLRGSAMLGTMMVMEPRTHSYLVADSAGHLKGWIDEKGGKANVCGDRAALKPVTFGGVHIANSGIFPYLETQTEESFSILTPYMQAVHEGKVFLTHSIEGSFWMDMGTPQQLEDLRRHLRGGPNGT